MDSRAWISLVLASIFFIQFSLVPSQASGKDLGIHGRLYEIREEDMLSYVRRKAGEISMAALRESMEKKLEESYAKHSFVSLDVPSATEERVRYVDPSVNVRNPLYDHMGKMIFPAGVVNPLDYVPLSKSILVLRENQVKRAVEKTEKKVKNQFCYSPTAISEELPCLRARWCTKQALSFSEDSRLKKYRRL